MNKLSVLIKDSWFGRILDSKVAALEKLDTSHFYVEEVRFILGTTKILASCVCELGVRQGFFEKRLAFFSPAAESGRMLASIKIGEEPPAELIDEVAEAMEAPRYRFVPRECKTLIFYKTIS